MATPPCRASTYQDLGLKIQSDLARVGIKVNLRPVDQVNLRTEYTSGKSKGGVLTFWNPPAVENQLWASAVVQRVAKRVHWTPPEDIMKLVSRRRRSPIRRSRPSCGWNGRR